MATDIQNRIYIPGVWDVLHIGHIRILKKAKELNGRLIVGVCSDLLCNKYNKHPYHTESERQNNILNLNCVDHAIIYNDYNFSKIYLDHNINILAIGEDFGYQGVPEHLEILEFCKRQNIRVIRFERTEGVSSTSIKQFWLNRASDVKGKKLGLWQATSLTETEEEAIKRKENDFKYIKPLFKNVNKESILELRCGTGRLTKEISKIFRKVYAIDYVQDFVDLAKDHTKSCKNIEFICDLAKNAPKKDYDCCLIAGLFISMNDVEVIETVNSIKNIPYIVVKESVGSIGRFEINKYSDTLKTQYQAIYRSCAEICQLFKGYILLKSELIEQHRKETNLQTFLFKKL